LSVDGDLAEISPGADLSAFRIVQEGLTNVLRHGGPVARVSIRCDADAVDIEVVDDGPSGWDGRPRPTGSTPLHGPGHGLVGMRERVALYSGRLTAAPRPGGGYLLAARLPYHAPVSASQP
jgi:signal transduction histidine kinase